MLILAKAPPSIPQIKQEPGLEAGASNIGGYDSEDKVPYTIKVSVLLLYNTPSTIASVHVQVHFKP